MAALVAGDVGQADRLADLYAEHTQVEHPMSPLGDRPLRTRAELRRHFASGPDMAGDTLRGFHAADIAIHDAADPEVIAAEFTYQGTGDGTPFRVPCVFVLRVRDGQIVASRDYVNHLAFAQLAGRLDDLFQRLRAA